MDKMQRRKGRRLCHQHAYKWKEMEDPSRRYRIMREEREDP